MNTLLQDLGYAARMLLRQPGFSLVVVATLALGIGANTAIFSIVNAVLLRPLPFKDPERLVMVSERRPTSGESNLPVAAYEFEAWRQQSHALEGIALIQHSGLSMSGKGDPETIKAWRVSADFFSVLGISPSTGRAFASGEDQAGKNNIVILSQKLWQRRFGSSQDLIGETVTLDDQPCTVIGIMPGLDLMPEAWLPIDLPGEVQKLGGQSHNSLNIIARLKPGFSPDQAQADLAHLAGQLEARDPSNNTGHGVQVIPLHEFTVGDVRPALLVLFGAVGFVLLIACANVSNLLLTRAAARQKEIAIRTAIGATRLRLIRQLLTESLLLATLGGALGLLLALWLTDLLPVIKAVKIPRLEQITLDGRVLGATVGFSLLTGILTGIAPAWRSYKPNLSLTLNEAGRSSTGPGRRRAGSLLVVFEVALTLILLVGSGLMIKSFVLLVSVEPGFSPNRVLRVDLSLPQLRYTRAEHQTSFYEQLIEQLKVLPGVEAVGATSQTPLRSNGNWGSVSVDGRPAPHAGQASYVAVCGVSDDYFSVMNIPMRRGRPFINSDGQNATPVVIVNETMARQFWPNEDPVGQHLGIDGGPWMAVIGVVGDVRHDGLNLRPNAEIFIPHLQAPQASMAVMVRTSVEPLSLAAAVREQVHTVDSDLPAPITTMDQIFADSVAGQRFNTLLLTLSGTVALLLAVVGVFGVINYSVTQRTQEIGLRIALGASSRDIFKLVVGRGLVLTLVGVGAGLAGALALTRLISDLLYGVSPTDAGIFVLVSSLLTAAALLACYLPARRATRVDPMVTLRG